MTCGDVALEWSYGTFRIHVLPNYQPAFAEVRSFRISRVPLKRSCARPRAAGTQATLWAGARPGQS